MKKIGFIIVLLCIAQLSKAQEPAAKAFYLHLKKAISSIDSAPITLTITEYGCLGSQSNMNAKIEKTDNLLKVSFYYQKRKDWANSLSDLETILDTTFMVEKSIFKKNLESEIIEIQSRPVFIEANFKILVDQISSNKEFQFRRGEGLYYMLRNNKTWATMFTKK